MTESTAMPSTPAPKRPRRRGAAAAATDQPPTGTDAAAPAAGATAPPATRTRRATRSRTAARAADAAPQPEAATTQAAQATEAADAPPRTRRRRATPATSSAASSSAASSTPSTPSPPATGTGSATRSGSTTGTRAGRGRSRRAAPAGGATEATEAPRSRRARGRTHSEGSGTPAEDRITAAEAAGAPAATEAPAAEPTGTDQPAAGGPGEADRAPDPAAPVRRAAEASAAPAEAPRPGSILTIAVGRAGATVGVVDADGAPVGLRIQAPVEFPCQPEDLVEGLRRAVAPAPAFERVAMGFPGTLRGGRVLSVPGYVTGGKGGLRDAWTGFDLAGAVEVALDKPVRAEGSALLAGAAVIEGRGLELVVTLDEGFAASLFLDGQPTPQLDLADQQFRKGGTYAEQLGDAGRKRAGRKKWNRRVQLALAALDRLLGYDRVYVGGTNARHVNATLGPKAQVLDSDGAVALSGGARLWAQGGPRPDGG